MSMLFDSGLAAHDHEIAAKVASQLWERLPEAVGTSRTGETFRAAETLYILGLIGRKYGWIPQYGVTH